MRAFTPHQLTLAFDMPAATDALDGTGASQASCLNVASPLPTFPIFLRETMPDAPLGVPDDLGLAQRLFQANCGPASFAALVGTLITDIIRFFPHFPREPHTSIPHMRRALQDCGVE